MKKIFVMLWLASVFLCGCNANLPEAQTADSKLCRIEVLSTQSNQVITTIENQDTIKQILEPSKWQTVDQLPNHLVEAYQLVVYQRKTLSQKQNPYRTKDYEMIQVITTYKDSPYIQSVSTNVLQDGNVSNAPLIFYYQLPDEINGVWTDLWREPQL